jgi:hypothetical protein
MFVQSSEIYMSSFNKKQHQWPFLPSVTGRYPAWPSFPPLSPGYQWHSNHPSHSSQSGAMTRCSFVARIVLLRRSDQAGV